MKSWDPGCQDPGSQTMTVTVKWAKERISFDLPPHDTPLAAIRDSLADYTHLPRDAFKLIHAGAIMRDDSAPISAYGLHKNSVIALIGTNDPPVQASSAPHHTSQQSTLTAIQAELAQNPTDTKEHLRLGELLLQSLLRLDAIAPEPAWDDVRRDRKDAVREVQAMLDRLDDAWAARSQ